MRWTYTGHILVLLMKSCRKGAGLRREKERDIKLITADVIFFLFFYFDRKLISCLPRFGIGSHLILICFGRNGKTSRDVWREQSCWSRDDSISFHSMAMLIPSNQIAKKSNHHPRLPAEQARSCILHVPIRF